MVLTDGPGAGGQPGIYYNLREGERIILTQMCFGVNTLNDSCLFELGFTDAVNGGGTFTPVTLQFEVVTGAAREGRATFTYFLPFVVLRHSAGVRSITYRVDANDASCDITVAWSGWTEPEF